MDRVYRTARVVCGDDVRRDLVRAERRLNPVVDCVQGVSLGFCGL